jgi:hypothetical protein
MEIKLNKVLQNSLNSFLKIKDEKLNDFLKTLKLEKFSISKEEINDIEKLYKENNALTEYIYIYIHIGEAIIQVSGGFWSIGKFKKDETYGLPIILGWGGDDMSPRICPDDWLYHIENSSLRKPLGDMIYSL